MYIKSITSGKNMITELLARKITERFSLESSAKWIRDSHGHMHIPKSVDKYTLIIEATDTVAPLISPKDIGKLFEIACNTYLAEYCEAMNDITREYQKSTLRYCDEGNVAASNYHEAVEEILKSGTYSYRPIVTAYLRSVDIVKADKLVTWKLKFEEQ